MESRRRAVAAGATVEQLRLGDDSNREADTLIARGKLSDAAAKLNNAAAAWSVAERDAREAAATAAEARGRAALNNPPKQDPPAINPPPASVANQPSAAKLPAANPRTEIEVAVAAYARAIESRDLAAVRHAYPGITEAQATGFQQFFGSVRTLKAVFTLASLDVNGNSAEGRLAGTYDYVTSAGKTEQQTVAFQATFRRDSGSWKLASVR